MEIKTYVAGPFMTNTYLIINDKKGIIVDPTIGLEKYIDDIKKNQHNSYFAYPLSY